MPPRTRYARNGEVSIAYQVVGDGPVDLVHGPGSVSHLEHHWEDPRFAHYLLAGDTDAFVDEIEAFVTGHRPAAVPDQVLATVLDVDVAGAPERSRSATAAGPICRSASRR